MTRTRPIERLAIANRGEAAMRCIRAVKALRAEESSDLRVISLYTDVDRDAAFVRHADLAVQIQSDRGAVAAYLDVELLLHALRRTRADAVWPGWGFVAENPDFAGRLAAAGIRFLGPSAHAMRSLGDKISAKHIAEGAGVPVIPWSAGALTDETDARKCAERLGYPVFLKASAGGGGRGIRAVENGDALASAFRAARGEAVAAFGDDRLFAESAVSGGRHIEVQIAADELGNVKSLGCRDCSVQRRHQKVIEEAPPAGLDAALLAELEQAAIRVAERVSYTGVGTIEFLVVGDAFFFLEMNPRLQVEHGITESVTGVDLVRIQIRIARGESIADLAVAPRGVAIEARVCAEDPDAGFLPSPGRIARFAPALGPRVRVDSGVAEGDMIPAAFDSLVAKVIASGEDREEARARLACALQDFELVIAGGASNKGFLLELLDAPAYRAADVDTTWVDRFEVSRGKQREYAVEALVAASILAYQHNRQAARLNFYADTSAVSAARIPPSEGQQIDLTHGAEQYRLEVFAVGSWRYRVYENGSCVDATLREEGENTARLLMGGRSLRVLYDAGEAGLRVEVEGRAHRFGLKTAGQVHASTPAMIVAIHVAPGDQVEVGQPLGVLEAMKMEIAFDAPVSGVVSEVRTRRGQQVAAGEVLLVIDPGTGVEDAGGSGESLVLPPLPDPLGPLFVTGEPAEAGELGAPDLAGAEALDLDERRRALEAVREEVRRVLLGYDANPVRAESLAAFLDEPLPEDLSEGFGWELAEIRRELSVFADLSQLFIRSPRASISGELGPSNNARLRMFVRRLRAGGAGIAPEFLELVTAAMAHYGIKSLEHSDALERAVLRLLASHQSSALRLKLVLGILHRVTSLARAGIDLGEDRALEAALATIAGMRGLVSDGVADAAADASYMIFERPRIERLAERTNRQLENWLASAETELIDPPEDVLLHLADAPRSVFDRVGRWLEDRHPRRRAISRAAHLRRLYSPDLPVSHRASLSEQGFDCTEFAGGRQVLGATCAADEIVATAESLARTAVAEADAGDPVHAIEIFVPVEQKEVVTALQQPVEEVLEEGCGADRLTVNFITPNRNDLHLTLENAPGGGVRRREDLLGIHPEAARRIDLARLDNFHLERIPSAEGIYCFFGRSREVSADERIFVLADARGRSPDGHEADLHLAAFERYFYEATRALRGLLAWRDPNRRLYWNRIALFVAPAIFLEPSLAQRLAHRLAPATRNLGLEKVVVRLQVLDRQVPDAPARPIEFVISDITGSNMELRSRKPHSVPLEARSDYERKVVEARRRRLVYPYEIIRMLTGGRRGAADAGVGFGWSLPHGRFEEYDLDESAPRPIARNVGWRPYGLNRSSIVFGVISTPSEKVPEGMSRVLILSDPTRGMGSLAAPECDRLVAALDLADEHGLPVEWIPVSSGARIAMDSGTENLDATARVVRRIVQFTQSGGVIHLIIHGVNVGAQSYFDALATMLMHTRGALIMTPRASMVLTGRAALEASGGVAAEDEVGIGGYERIMGPNGEAQYLATDLADAYRILYEHYRYTYVVPGEAEPRSFPTADSKHRSICDTPCNPEESEGFERVGEIFDNAANPGRKRPFAMRAVMEAVIDRDGGHLERWRGMSGAGTAIVWDAHVGGRPVCLIGIESRNIEREGYRPLDGPESWSGGTLFPMSSKKVARAINAASGNRPVVVLANLSGFDGSPESMRKLQLEYGAEIARAVVNFEGPISFLVVSRYHGGAYVVFSQALNPGLRASALSGSFASVIGGGPAAAVVFSREVRARAAAEPRVVALEKQLESGPSAELREQLEVAFHDACLEKQAELAADFDAIHTVDRARRVGSLCDIIEPAEMRAFLVREIS